jgi:hypothetical protein
MRLARAAVGLPALLAAVLFSLPASALTLFWEDFDGYKDFPAREPWFDPINRGVPEISEGADELWFGARFEKPDSPCRRGGVGCDLAVQKFGGRSNPTPVGRFADDAGLLFSVDTTGLAQVMLSFDWRTFSASSADQLVAGYFVGDIPLSAFGKDRTADFLSGPYAWASWTTLIVENAHDAFTHHVFSLPANAGTLWIAFWLDNGDHDYGKIDNVHVSGVRAAPPPVPEPGAALLLGAALCAAFVSLAVPRARERRARRAYSRTS